MSKYLLFLIFVISCSCWKFAPTSRDVDRCNDLVGTIRKEVNFPVRSSLRDGDTLYVDPQPGKIILVLYGYSSPGDRDRISGQIGKIINREGFSGVELYFYERELKHDKLLQHIKFK